MNEVPTETSATVYVSGIRAPQRSDTSFADRVVTVCQDSIEDNISGDTEYSWYNMSDGSTEYGGRLDDEIFDAAASEVLEAIESGETVLVHCHAGRSRSVSVVAAALAAHDQCPYDFDRALGQIMRARGTHTSPDYELCEHARRFADR